MASAPEFGPEMTSSPTTAHRAQRRIRMGLPLGASAGLAGWASGTTPFTATAYTLVAVVALVMVVGALGRWRRFDGGSWRALPLPIERAPTTWRTVAPWLAVVAVVVAVELLAYFLGGSRTIHPTISSAVDALFAHRPAKAAGLLGWLAGGWYLVRR